MIMKPQMVQKATYQMSRKANQNHQTNIGNKTSNHRVLKQSLMRVVLPKMMMMMMLTRLMMIVMVVGIVKIMIKVMTVMMKKVTVMKILRVKTK